MRRRRVLHGLPIACAVVAAATGSALAQDELLDFEHQNPARDPVLNLRYEAIFMAPGGRVFFPGSAIRGDIDLEVVGIDGPQLSPTFRLAVNEGFDPDAGFVDRLSGSIQIMHFDTDVLGTVTLPRLAGPIALSPGDRVRAQYDFLGVDARLGWDPIRWTPETRDGTRRLQFAGTGGVGFRVHQYDISVRRLSDGAMVADGGTFFEPLIFVQGRAELYERFELSVGGSFGTTFDQDAGGNGTSSSWDLAARMGIHLTPYATVGFGYRILEFDVEQGEGINASGLNGSFAGIGFDVSLRF
ncbi:MAG: hypothetical protein AAFX79_01830 [Planctomycetota bacterium]